MKSNDTTNFIKGIDTDQPYEENGKKQIILEAGSVYVLLKKDIPIPRSSRIQWFFSKINQVVSIPQLDSDWNWVNSENEMELISVVPNEPHSTQWRPEINHMFSYRITCKTKVWFLAHRYRLTVCLDMSPSQSTVDTQRGEVLIDEMFESFKLCLKQLAQPFAVPGSQIIIEPTLYITIIAHTPFFTTPAQQVLIKGVRFSQHNFNEILNTVETQLKVLEEKISQVSALAHDQIDVQRANNERLVGGLFEEDNLGNENGALIANIPMVSPDASFINMLRYSMLALSLLPDNSLGNILIITDGVICMPDVNILESLLQQLHFDSTSVSFLIVGSPYHPHCSFGYVASKDILHFIARATLGTFTEYHPDYQLSTLYTFNSFMRSVLFWTFNSQSQYKDDSCMTCSSTEWSTPNGSFHGTKSPVLLHKKQSEDKMNSSLNIIIERRLREGYTLDSVNFENERLEVNLSLPWKTHTYLLYSLSGLWPSFLPQSIQYLVSIKAPYECLHDTTCQLKKQLKSLYRQAVVERFWATLAQLASGDTAMSQHLSSFANSNIWYTLPESVRNGMPVFVMLPTVPVDISKPHFTANDMACPKFSSFWQSICQLESSHWRKWFHTHRLSIILRHDHPLPRHLHLANSSGRFTVVQCRKAAAALHNMLKEWTSFVLIDSYSYIKFIFKYNEKNPSWFCMIRVTSKLPCAVLNIGFLSGTPGYIRQEVCDDLKKCITNLVYTVRTSTVQEIEKNSSSKHKDNICCVILHKPLEKILIRYERLPNDLTTVVFPDGTQPSFNTCYYNNNYASQKLHTQTSINSTHSVSIPTSAALLTTLSRYLHHRRWVWGVSHPTNPKLAVTAVARILSTLTKMRIKEGFCFAHSSSGIINMVLEVEMKNTTSSGKNDKHIFSVGDDNKKSSYCVIQYVLFPPHNALSRANEHSVDILSGSDDENADGIGEFEGESPVELQMVTEVWIEPQHGCVTNCPPERIYMQDLSYFCIANAIGENDSKCINSLLTLEHLSLMCQKNQLFDLNCTTESNKTHTSHLNSHKSSASNKITELASPLSTEDIRYFSSVPENKLETEKRDEIIPLVDKRIHHMPFLFNLMNILPKCRQAEILFSTFSEVDFSKKEPLTSNLLLLNSMFGHLQKLNDQELFLKGTDSQIFLELMLNRRKEFPNSLKEGKRSWCSDKYKQENSQLCYPLWRCFIKGISVTHITLTFVPASLCDLQLLKLPQTSCKRQNSPVEIKINNSLIFNDVIVPEFSLCSHYGVYDVPNETDSLEYTSSNTEQNEQNSDSYPSHRITQEVNSDPLVFPVFVYDCPLATLINAYIYPNYGLEGDFKMDIYEDHTFKSGHIVSEEFVTLKSADDTRTCSPEINSDDSEETEDRVCLKQHCHTLTLAHSKCFVACLFRSLHLKHPIHSLDIQAAVDLCENTVIRIDITKYIKTVCGHGKKHHENKNLDIQLLYDSGPCRELRHLHRLIKNKFKRTVEQTFEPVPSNEDFYYCIPNNGEKATYIDEEVWDSDDEIIPEPVEGKETPVRQSKFELNIGEIIDITSDCIDDSIAPLFLHFTCTVTNFGTVPVRVLPTCLGDIFQELDVSDNFIDLSELEVTLDVICSTLPKDVQTIIMERSQQGLRTTSYCSVSPLQRSSISSDSSLPSETLEPLEQCVPLTQLLPYQSRAISILEEEIKWQLREEIATSLLNVEAVSSETLHMVIQHVETSVSKTSCLRDAVPLNFVYGSAKSMSKFIEEFRKLPVPSYKLCELEELYYLAKELPYQQSDLGIYNETETIKKSVKNLQKTKYKKRRLSKNSLDSDVTMSSATTGNESLISGHLYDFHHNSNLMDNDLLIYEIQCLISELLDEVEASVDTTKGNKKIPSGFMSEISTPAHFSDNSSTDSDNGYDGGTSDPDDDPDWLAELDRKRKSLSNFWMIMKINDDAVTIYFHCRFLELCTPQVNAYLAVQRSVICAIKNLCKHVNQFLLLQSLNDTRTCDRLLEPEEVNRDIIWNSQSTTPVMTRNTSFTRLKSFDDTSTTDNIEIQGQHAYFEASLKFMPGFFACPVVWETHFILHPRLKTGNTRPTFSRGIQALRTVLNKFSVVNRNNMFVYRDNSANVFYLRLHENVSSGIKHLNPSFDEDIHTLVSRSPSIASLPLGPQRQLLAQSEQSNVMMPYEIRPRVRSFGEKDSVDANSNIPIEDTITLKVHGVTNVGNDIIYELVQVLQNRLDDAVLEVLSVMLERNPMCKLTPDDVHFLQKPFRSPERIIQLSVQCHALVFLDSLQYYLQQNLLQFLHIPKYTDVNGHHHFRDYTETDQSTMRVSEKNVFLYNQSHSSGSIGIACIALAIVQNSPSKYYLDMPLISDDQTIFEEIVASDIIEPEDKSIPTLVEFRIWQKGRVNIETLTGKLRSAVKHATWDLIMEHHLLAAPLIIPIEDTEFRDLEYLKKSKKESISLSANLSSHKRNKIEHKTQSLEETKNKAQFKKTLSDIEIPVKSACKEKITNIKQISESDKFSEANDFGILHDTYSKIMLKWFEFALDIKVPSVTKHSVRLSHRHPVGTTIYELQHMIKMQTKDIVTRAFTTFTINQNQQEFIFIPFDENQTSTDCLIFGRNFNQWKSSYGIIPFNADYLEPKANKVLQRFSPLIIDSETAKFVPRQRLLTVSLTSNLLNIYTYNWSKERMDKIITHCDNLGMWLSTRATVFSSVTSQKLGLFHNQPVNRKTFASSSQYAQHISDPDHMARFPLSGSSVQFKDWSIRRQPQNQQNASTSLNWNDQNPIQESFRDINFPRNRDKMTYSSNPIIHSVRELQQARHYEKKMLDEERKLLSVWPSRGATPQMQIQSSTIQLLKQKSRIIHYCHTPLLFLPRWRIQSAATRDHSLYIVEDQIYELQTNSGFQKTDQENWHDILCAGFVEEYKKYLHTLGFIPLQIIPNTNISVTKKSGNKVQSKNEPQNPVKNGLKVFEQENTICFLQKSMLGGILIFELVLVEPFFIAKLYALECGRLQNKNSRASVNQFTLSFLDECDRIKVLMHIHSFTYDFHLRCMHKYVSGLEEPNIKICQGYHLTHFLDDFMKYYSKAPNYARNLVYAESVSVDGLTTPARQLYNYLLSHEKRYNMEVFSMNADDIKVNNCPESDFVLVQVTNTPQVSYKDSQDRKHTDDFNVTLIVSYIDSGSDDTKILHLKYYILLTSRREIYPKPEVERTLGKFRTVSSTASQIGSNSLVKNRRISSNTDSDVNTSIAQEVMEESSEDLILSTDTISSLNISDITSSIKLDNKVDSITLVESAVESTETKIFATGEKTINDDIMASINSKTNISESEHSYRSTSDIPTAINPHVEIRQESVNYLGYYSSHEQLMQQLILDCAESARIQITNMVSQGMVHCRTHLLWNKLITKSELSQLTYNEFIELRQLSKLENIKIVKPEVSQLLSQPIGWFQQLAKILVVKYGDQHRIYTSPDGNDQHIVILHPRYCGAFMMLSMDLTRAKGELFAAYREPVNLEPTDVCQADCHTLVNDFINCICFHIWMIMTLSNT